MRNLFDMTSLSSKSSKLKAANKNFFGTIKEIYRSPTEKLVVKRKIPFLDAPELVIQQSQTFSYPYYYYYQQQKALAYRKEKRKEEQRYFRKIVKNIGDVYKSVVVPKTVPNQPESLGIGMQTNFCKEAINKLNLASIFHDENKAQFSKDLLNPLQKNENGLKSPEKTETESESRQSLINSKPSCHRFSVKSNKSISSLKRFSKMRNKSNDSLLASERTVVKKRVVNNLEKQGDQVQMTSVTTFSNSRTTRTSQERIYKVSSLIQKRDKFIEGSSSLSGSREHLSSTTSFDKKRKPNPKQSSTKGKRKEKEKETTNTLQTPQCCRHCVHSSESIQKTPKKAHENGDLPYTNIRQDPTKRTRGNTFVKDKKNLVNAQNQGKASTRLIPKKSSNDLSSLAENNSEISKDYMMDRSENSLSLQNEIEGNFQNSCNKSIYSLYSSINNIKETINFLNTMKTKAAQELYAPKECESLLGSETDSKDSQDQNLKDSEKFNLKNFNQKFIKEKFLECEENSPESHHSSRHVKIPADFSLEAKTSHIFPSEEGKVNVISYHTPIKLKSFHNGHPRIYPPTQSMHKPQQVSPNSPSKGVKHYLNVKVHNLATEKTSIQSIQEQSSPPKDLRKLSQNKSNSNLKKKPSRCDLKAKPLNNLNSGRSSRTCTKIRSKTSLKTSPSARKITVKGPTKMETLRNVLQNEIRKRKYDIPQIKEIDQKFLKASNPESEKFFGRSSKLDLRNVSSTDLSVTSFLPKKSLPIRKPSQFHKLMRKPSNRLNGSESESDLFPIRGYDSTINRIQESSLSTSAELVKHIEDIILNLKSQDI